MCVKDIRMLLLLQGNIQGWGGPLTQDFINDQRALQLQILNATRNYGMINVSDWADWKRECSGLELELSVLFDLVRCYLDSLVTFHKRLPVCFPVGVVL